jgi:formate dehydrogenase maturation protein FdhE
LKTIDLGRLGLAVPLVDEVAGATLDVWARSHGYEKIELNLVGL